MDVFEQALYPLKKTKTPQQKIYIFFPVKIKQGVIFRSISIHLDKYSLLILS